MKNPQLRSLFGYLPLLACAPTATAATSFTAVGVYDENTTATNTIDSQAPGNPMSSAAFKTAVATAFAAGNGGVINFDAASNVTNETTLNITYATSKTFAVTTATNTLAGTNPGANIATFTGLSPISGTRGFLPTASDITKWTLNLGTINVGELISTAGFTLLNRNIPGQNVTVNWFIDGQGTAAASQTDAIATGTAPSGNDDTFFSYTAPNGSRISAIEINFSGTGDNRLAIDDLGFITVVPEPSTAAVLALGTLVLAGRRRRHS